MYLRDMNEFTVHQPTELAGVAQAFLAFAGERRVALFSGQVGAGKTTFIQAIGRELGIDEAITSPTYALVNEYASSKLTEPVYHLDLYRLNDLEEGLRFGLEEYLFSGSWCFIEWPELLTPLLEDLDAIGIQISINADSSRKILFLE